MYVAVCNGHGSRGLAVGVSSLGFFVPCPLGRAMTLALERPAECQERCASESGDDAGGELSWFEPREIVDEFHP